MGDISDIQTGGTPKTKIKEYWNPKEIPWMSSGEINKKRIKKTDKKISIFGHENSSARWIKKNSVLVALAGQGKTRGLVAVNEINLTTNQSIAAIIPTESLYFEFLFHNLEKRYEELRSISSGDGTRGGLNKQLVSNLLIKLPAYDEQVKIGEILKKVDILINLHQKRANKLMSVRQEFLNKIFEIHTDCELRLRFNSFNDKWNKVSLGAVGKTQSGIGFPDSEQGGEVGIPFFKVSDMNKPGNEYEMLNANNYVSEEQVELRNWKPIEDLPAIMFAKVGAAIFLNRKRIIRTPFLIDNNTMAYIFDKNWDPIFGKTLFDTINLAKYAQVGALPSYNSKDIESIVVYIPNLNEQIKVGKFFKEIDVIIEKNKDIINRLNVIKTSYLQKIFL